MVRASAAGVRRNANAPSDKDEALYRNEAYVGDVAQVDGSVNRAPAPRPLREIAAALVKLSFGEPNLMDFLRGPPGSGTWVGLMCELRDSLADEERIPPPIDMILPCPRCGMLHVDAPEPDNGWANPPHKSHLCHGCGCIWRPASVPTNGVEALATIGSADTWTPADQDSARWRLERFASAMEEARKVLAQATEAEKSLALDVGEILNRVAAGQPHERMPIEQRADEIEALLAKVRRDFADMLIPSAAERH